MARCNAQLRHDDFLPQALIRRSNVEALCTTDGPLDDLEYHRLLAAKSDFSPRVLPTFRPDELFDACPDRFLTFVSRLAQKTQRAITSLDRFLAALEARVDFSTARAVAYRTTVRWRSGFARLMRPGRPRCFSVGWQERRWMSMPFRPGKV